MEPFSDLVQAVRDAARGLVVVTGAGISAASGLPTFRGSDPGAIWATDVTEIGTIDWFLRRPVEWWQWFGARFAGILEAEPNEAHRALASLETWQLARGGEFLLVTQNVDLLHEKSEAARLVKIHGSADRVRCTRDGCEHGAPSGSLPIPRDAFERFEKSPSAETLPRCDGCGALLRAHALLFDEYYTGHLDYRFEEAAAALERAQAIVFVGTSFSVGITELALQAGRASRARLFSIDPVAAPPRGVVALRGNAEDLLPRLVEELRR